ncbi:MAG TPA: hypothetical protein VNB49_04960 [Candidatus Dormibacteraeota bacterium]|nr:hypothetical protein [Candidatus Dormibacteraeota bacterium]
MPFQKRIVFPLMLSFALMAATAAAKHSKRMSSPAMPTIALLRTPHEGIQPQTLLDHRGVLHMIYFKGDASGGDIEYVSRSLTRKTLVHRSV